MQRGSHVKKGEELSEEQRREGEGREKPGSEETSSRKRGGLPAKRQNPESERQRARPTSGEGRTLRGGRDRPSQPCEHPRKHGRGEARHSKAQQGEAKQNHGRSSLFNNALNQPCRHNHLHGFCNHASARKPPNHGLFNHASSTTLLQLPALAVLQLPALSVLQLPALSVLQLPALSVLQLPALAVSTLRRRLNRPSALLHPTPQEQECKQTLAAPRP
ncbi:uncharacterized protein LOC126982666 [Eriocheir sinensis]|uniref:uncharacterized protein LOC126982666 n=1 Tax=Eriocheir sinensis TaxID=95602 RepID=UPI0021C945F3|nr:uncharacterized protein LOC126982666 [Eriocheir sinensis]